mmetsp:Transcript_10854/g.22702  ORF Transcript_10854/g.22702 Transcript_10854/m.22702 type:complete len:304 (-) Transcript_10854:114-1025(-)|eukprot:CAMPEP_0171360950 /NCGR_PEP_ID=MMETSP0879-20121228/1621_1 /TAXON_ID=67004 /ORGANISM="Thalassiosira weissflogii, Strain CCMP1336" /LENGTH=303 /DNA_ID=CAMNT_0011867471 /DNA_START=34 /DNA_END=945 /DNA_ORIENTATION=-
MTKFKAALIDLSGTLHIGKTVIPGAIDACRKLHKNNIRVVFLTNTSKISSSTLLNQLRSMGFDSTVISGQECIMTSVSATRQFLLNNKLRPLCLVEDELVKEDFRGVEMHDPNCVLVGLAPNSFHYEKLNEAFRLLLRLKENQKTSVQEKVEPRGNETVENESDISTTNSGKSSDNVQPHLIAIHRATHYRDSDHQLSLGPGGFISLLEQTTGASAHVIGKPSYDFYRAAISSIGIEDPSEVIMVGDDVVGDVQGALDAGLGGAVLVKTGKYVEGDELGEKTGGVFPTMLVDSVVEAVDYICS